MHRVRATGEDDNRGAERSNGFKGGSAGETDRADRKLSDTASDKVSILRTEIENEDDIAFMLGHGLIHGENSSSGIRFPSIRQNSIAIHDVLYKLVRCPKHREDGIGRNFVQARHLINTVD